MTYSGKDIRRFWSKVIKNGPIPKGKPCKGRCWIWVGNEKNYGIFHVDNKSIPAHRVAFEITHGRQVREHLLLCHQCDNKRCVNPAHLREGTNRDNMLEYASRKGNGYDYTDVITHIREEDISHYIAGSTIWVAIEDEGKWVRDHCPTVAELGAMVDRDTIFRDELEKLFKSRRADYMKV